MKNSLPTLVAGLLIALFTITATAETTAMANTDQQRPVQVAFMPDIHFHDIYADFRDEGFAGISNDDGHKHASIRSMAAQLHSTRLFNENYFALLAALDHAVKSGIRYIGLPGDFSDDGQPVHLNKLATILDEYRDRHNVMFFATPGNHDPVRPDDTPGGKSDFLNTDGSEISIQSPGTKSCQDKSGRQTDSLICSEKIRHLGYQGVTHTMRNNGFFPQKSYLYWATPFTAYTPDNYQFEAAVVAGSLAKRHSSVCAKTSASQPDLCIDMPDTSYLVEPTEGLWLLAIDANVYLPKTNQNGLKTGFSGSGNAGYNAIAQNKEYLLQWIEQVVIQAQLQGKRLISFSHFPMVDFYDEQGDSIKSILGRDAFQLKRLPKLATSERILKTGLHFHISGHMHMNDTGVYRSQDGKTLFNIQAPSLAAYPPAYKVVSLLPKNRVQVDTIRLQQVPRFNELFPHYQREHQYLLNNSPENAWNIDVLNAENYNDFTKKHLRELVRERFIPNEWPSTLVDILTQSTLHDLAILAQLDTTEKTQDIVTDLATLKNKDSWRQATDQYLTELTKTEMDGLSNDVTGFDLLVDLYMLRNGGDLAQEDIGSNRLSAYKALAQLYQGVSAYQVQNEDKPVTLPVTQQFISGVLQLLMGFMDAEPDNRVMLDLTAGRIQNTSP
ncbi:metallophosphoesterase [Gilvimarinus agarilyticus]|uniref:metallophosphoesterase n=1 Tax=Gilvimarinus sp. 2_MG-2023 TaxID=3062666 RepID=UPI001C0A5C2C|nr:metallophosphoesterase [Gilvimarinus sp. 2_MG-2023]MBU2887101.1 metallophosphoesterase [Gilvimarinus agarilyticus]MDO6571760.1 metallophosphoesterase [Gilvimarinus sp. 2_MG-2023]